MSKSGKLHQRQHESGYAWRHFVIFVFIFASGIAAPAYATVDPDPALSYAGGDGTMATPYLISNLSELHRLSDTSSDWTKFFELSADIDAADTSTWNGGAGWLPIAWVSDGFCECFRGSFDGKGHTITGLVINRPAENFVGLFKSTLGGATIKNVHLEGGSMKGNIAVGSLVADNRGTISSCSASSEVTAAISDVGGLVGKNDSTGIITSSYATGNVLISTVEKFNYAGGLIGSNRGTVSMSYATGNVVGKAMLGGLIGYNWGGTVDRSYATGDVEGEIQLGGLVGVCYDDAEVSLSYATGNVTNLSGLGGGNSDELGGLIGRADTLCTVSSSYAWGDVAGSVSLSQSVGGLVGIIRNSSSVTSSYAIGNVTGEFNYTGGLVGVTELNGSVSSSYWDIETSGTSVGGGSGGTTGLTSAQMKLQASFPGFDFLADWLIVEGFSPPLLQWQNIVFNNGFEGD